MKRWRIGILTMAVAVGLPGCWWRKKVPPPMIAAPPASPKPAAKPAELGPPPKVEAAQTPQAVPPGTRPPELPAPPPPKAEVKPKPPRRARTQPAAAQVPAAEAPTVPQLAPLLTAAEQESLNKFIDAALAATRSNLEKVKGRRLTPGQNTELQRVRAVVKQAQSARSRDLSTARSLAERAQVLSKDLADSLR